MGPHYPTGAELAQFRRAIRAQHPDGWRDGPDRDGATDPAAWPDERAHGIGWSAGTEWPLLDGRPAWQDARALAGAMRSRAADRCPACGMRHGAGAVWHGGIGHRFVGTDSGDACYRCGIVTLDLDAVRESLVPDCAGPDNGARHIWIAALDGIECAAGCPAYVRADGTGAWTFACS